MKKENVTPFLEEIAEKMGYRLVPKIREAPEVPLPRGSEKYSNMSAQQLAGALKDVHIQMEKLKGTDDAIRERMIKFMNVEQSNEHTRSLFNNTNFDSNKLIIRNNDLVLATNLSNHISNIMKDANEKEMKSRFSDMNPEFGEMIKCISIGEAQSGMGLFVDVGTSGPEKESPKEDTPKDVPPIEPEETGPGVQPDPDDTEKKVPADERTPKKTGKTQK